MNIVKKEVGIIPVEQIMKRIFMIRGEKVMIDRDLAELYGTETRVLNQTVRRNIQRFPNDFMFSLTREEIANLSQFVISPKMKHSPNVFVFTEQGVAMLSSVLKSRIAVAVNIQIMRSFIKLRKIIFSNTKLRQKLELMEKKYDKQFAIVFEAIKNLLIEKQKPKRRIGFKL